MFYFIELIMKSNKINNLTILKLFDADLQMDLQEKYIC